MKFLTEVFRTYKLASLLIILTPEYAARVLFSLMGYYRHKSVL